MKIPSLKGLDLTPASPTKPASGTALDGFGTALKNAIDGLNEVQNVADDKAVELAAGGAVDVHEVVLARETANLHFQLALQVRNKLVEAYQDVMRMQL
ncbi:MAG: flagellar hook-basal body complex protein FliE [Chloroflexi bacterium]|nr:flagellar hook-basal body complex protein FliE [Chloroflexota bacterium]